MGDVDVGQAVGVAAAFVEGGEGFGVARQGAVGGSGRRAARTISKGQSSQTVMPLFSSRSRLAGWREGAAAEGQDGGAAAFDPGHVLADDGGFDAAEFGLAARFEDFGDGDLFGGFDLVIGIEEAPAQAMGQMAADGAFAGSHEADHVDAGRALELEVHAVPLMAAMRDSTTEGKRRMASDEEPAGAGRDHGAGVALHTAANGFGAALRE